MKSNPPFRSRLVAAPAELNVGLEIKLQAGRERTCASSAEDPLVPASGFSE